MVTISKRGSWLKASIFASLLALVFSLVATVVTPASAEDSVKDQANDASIGGGTLTLFTSTTTRAQTFSPTKPNLTQIDVYLKDRVAGSWVEIALINESTAEVVTTAGTRMGAGDGWESIGISATLNTSNVYRIKVYNESSLGVKWTYNSGNPYPGGMLFFGDASFNEDNDLNFRTWGYDDPVEEPAVDQSEEPTADSTDSSAATTEELGVESASIAKPTSLSAAYSEEKSGVELSWTASSTTDIDGYKVFRSESYSKGYTKIGQTDKNTLEYLDEDFAPGKTYYYLVRAYKGNEQSASSNIKSVTLPDDIAPAKPQKFSVVSTDQNTLTARWKKSEATNIAGYTISLYKGSEKVRTKDLEADINEYSFLELEPGMLYRVELVAKDSDGRTSSPAIAFGVTKLPEDWVKLFTTFNLAASVVIVVLLGILIVNTIRDMRRKKLN